METYGFEMARLGIMATKRRACRNEIPASGHSGLCCQKTPHERLELAFADLLRQTKGQLVKVDAKL